MISTGQNYPPRSAATALGLLSYTGKINVQPGTSEIIGFFGSYCETLPERPAGLDAMPVKESMLSFPRMLELDAAVVTSTDRCV